MAASAGQLLAIGASGKQYSLDVYQPDAVATELTFNPSGLAAATSPATYRFPENVTIRDISIVTGATAVGGTLKLNGATINGATFRWAIHLNTLPARPILNLQVEKGADLSILQH